MEIRTNENVHNQSFQPMDIDASENIVDNLIVSFQSFVDTFQEDGEIIDNVRNWIIENKQDETALFQSLRNLQSNPSTYCLLGIFYQNGIGTIVSNKESFFAFEKAAEKRYPYGLYRLGNFYNRPRNIEHIKKAVDYYKRAAELGCPRGFYNLALYHRSRYLRWIEVCQPEDSDPEKAFKYFEKAWEIGYFPALIPLAECYDSGFGTRKNTKRAFKLYCAAAERGDYGAQRILCGTCCTIRTSDQRKGRGFESLRISAEQKNRHGQYFLTKCYWNAPADYAKPTKGYYWVAQLAKFRDPRGLTGISLANFEGNSKGTMEDIHASLFAALQLFRVDHAVSAKQIVAGIFSDGWEFIAPFEDFCNPHI
ncbi:hypothetical protein G9A89_000092 [Geosiphon pyriformis]|nr:hypothetical protein G9A89_000092 [Geosiphon pyriformis]